MGCRACPALGLSTAYMMAVLLHPVPSRVGGFPAVAITGLLSTALRGVGEGLW